MAFHPYISDEELFAMGGMPAHVLEGYAQAKRVEAATLASDVADGYARPRFKPPFTSPGGDWKMRVAFVAIYFLASQLGASPEGADSYIRDNYQDAIRWFERVQEGKAVPSNTDDQTPGVSDLRGPAVFTSTPRGW